MSYMLTTLFESLFPIVFLCPPTNYSRNLSLLFVLSLYLKESKQENLIGQVLFRMGSVTPSPQDTKELLKSFWTNTKANNILETFTLLINRDFSSRNENKR